MDLGRSEPLTGPASAKAPLAYTLPGDLDPHVEALRMQARCLAHSSALVAADLKGANYAGLQGVPEAISLAAAADSPAALLAAAPLIAETLSAWNLSGGRLRGRSLARRAAQQSPPALLPPPTPCELIDEGAGWASFGMHARASEFVGHGFWWKARPPGCAEPLTNMAGRGRAGGRLCAPAGRLRAHRGLRAAARGL